MKIQTKIFYSGAIALTCVLNATAAYAAPITTTPIVVTKPTAPITKPTPTPLTYAQKLTIKRTALVKTAASKKGLKYRWGGVSPTRGFDCSGFTQWVYKQNGITIPRTTSQQVRAGKIVTLKSALPGDLVFSNGGGHVGVIATAGGKTMWHSPRTGRSVSLDETRWYRVTKVVRIVR